MKTFYWNTPIAHHDNNQTMQEYLYDHCELEVKLVNGTYAEGEDEDGNLYSIQASGNGDSFNHKVEIELIKENLK